METLTEKPPVSLANGSDSPLAPVGTHWLWWLFLAGIMACSFAGQTCALN